MRTKWAEKSTIEKILLVARIVISIAIIVVVFLRIRGVWMDALYVAIPLSGVNLVIQSVMEWKERRDSAIFGFFVAAFIFVCSIVVWFVK